MKEVTLPPIDFYCYDTTDIAYSDTSNFKDTYHLNRKGAAHFTEELIATLKSEI